MDNICNITADNMSTNVPEPLLSLKDITYAYNTPKDEIPALKAYSTNPLHVAVADGKVRPYTAVRSCLDYEV